MGEDKEKLKKGFWRRLLDNVEPYKPHSRFREIDRLDEERKRLSDDFGYGLLRSSIYSQARSAREGE